MAASLSLPSRRAVATIAATSSAPTGRARPASPFGVVALHDAQRIGGHGAARVGPAGDPGEEGGGCGGLGDRGRRQAVGSEAEDVLGQGGVRERPSGERRVQALEGGPVGAAVSAGARGLQGERGGARPLGREPGQGGQRAQLVPVSGRCGQWRCLPGTINDNCN